jgi:predicted AlkP superfamily phosphohydrolase/phosphomutase
MKKKVLIIGLDGAEPTILYQLAKTGTLPTFQGLMMNGVYGKLKSTIPPTTLPAWTSSVTGLNPAKHGIFDFFLNVDLKRKEIEYANSSKRKAKAVWNLLSQQGKTAVVINVPGTYPPEKNNGVIISGMLTPSLRSNFVHPSNLKQKLLELGYKIDIGNVLLDILLRYENNKFFFLSAIKDLVRKRLNITEYLMKEFDWDFLMVTFVALDRLHHWFWDLMDSTHIAHNPRIAKVMYKHIIEVYLEIDKAIRRLLVMAGKDTNVIIYSDHGFRSSNKFFFVNSLLFKEKLLKLRDIKIRGPFMQEKIFNIAAKLHLEKLVEKMPANLKRKIAVKMIPSKNFFDVFQLDPENSKAFLFSSFIRFLEEEENIIQKVQKSIENTTTQLSLGLKVFKREEIFHGQLLCKIPPLVILSTKDVFVNHLIPINQEFFMYYSESIKVPSLMRSGEHSLYGILMMVGPDIKRGIKIQNANIMDIMPTILHLLGESVPEYVDGKVLISAIKT